MKTRILILSFVLAVVSCFSIEANAKPASKIVKVGNFTSIITNGVCDLHIAQSDDYRVELKGDAIEIECVELNVDGDTLVISYRFNEINVNRKRRNVDVYVSLPDLYSVKINAVGKTSIDKAVVFEHKFEYISNNVGDTYIRNLKCNEFIFRKLNVGKADINVEADKIDVMKTNVGELKMNAKGGKVDYVSKGIGGSTLNVECQKVTISSGSLGGVKVSGHAVSANIFGNVKYSGLKIDNEHIVQQ